jgi:methionyl-tRNA synthetase
MSRYTITAALPYANGPLHIGHLAGAYLPADIFVRYLRLNGHDVAFICGSDEHGAAITLRAKKEGITPKEIIDKYHLSLKTTFEQFGIAFSIYYRTSEKLHYETAQDVFLQLEKNGVFTVKESEQFFDEEFQQFLADRYIVGTCPKCGHDQAYGDQCEKCGSSLNPTDLIHPISTLSGKTPVLKTTKHWYLPMQNYEAWLKDWIVTEKKDLWKTNVYGQCKSWLEQGLQERAMTRDLDWGVPVPIPNNEGKVLYVWLDAPIGYISATKEWAKQNNKNWEDYWCNSETKLIHFIGKDNIVFHCIIFPIILKACGNFILPENVPANEFMNLEGNKISTSRNWAVWLHEYLQDFPHKQDSLRYALTAMMPETKDNDFTWKEFQAKNNNELADIFGNFVNRVVVLTHKFFEGKVPNLYELNESDQALITAIQQAPSRIAKSLEGFRFREAQNEMMNLVRAGNRYLTDNEPWKLIKTEPERTATILHLALQLTANLSIVAQPFLPHTTQKLQELLQLPHDLGWKAAGNTLLVPTSQAIGTTGVLFEKITDEAIETQIQKLENSKQSNMSAAIENPIPAIKEDITFDDFAKLDLRVATIVAAQKVPKADKLLQLTLDLGLEQRTVLSGIAEHYSPEEIVGKQVCLVANLAPRKIRGIMSQGMVLMAEDSNGKLTFVAPTQALENGSVIR